MVINAYILAAEPAYIEASVGAYYDLVETIVVSYDRSGRGWTGTSVPLEECLERLRAIDRDRKMRFLPGDFACPGRTPIENDTAQRQEALAVAGQGADWVLTLDTDEVLPDARALTRRLETEVPPGIVAVEWPMRSFYRRLDSGRFLEVCTPLWRQLSEYPGPVAVRPGVTLHEARRVRPPSPVWRFDIRRVGVDPLKRERYRADGVIERSEAILHFSWARSESDLLTKLQSWSHSTDFDAMRYFEEVWKPAPKRWPWMRHFHPIWPRLWPALRPSAVPSRVAASGEVSVNTNHNDHAKDNDRPRSIPVAADHPGA